MIFNFTRKHQLSTRISLNERNIEIIPEMKLLGVVVTDDLKWHKNTKHLTKRAWIRMQLLKKVAGFGASMSEKLDIYKKIVRSVLEQSCTVWHSSLTKGNEKDLERVQKAAVKIITNKPNLSYEEGLELLNIQRLKKRREILCLRFAKKCIQTKKTSRMFKLNTKIHKMKTRTNSKYKITKTRTERLKRSAIP